MASRTRLTSLESVREDGSFLFTVQEPYGEHEEVVVVPCEDGVEAYRNYCMHETDQRLAREGIGAVIRDGGIICPRHGSTFDTCTGDCDNGKAKGFSLSPVDVETGDGQVYLVDDAVTYLWDGGLQDDDADDTPDSTSHLNF